jgi:hypothetical protein
MGTELNVLPPLDLTALPAKMSYAQMKDLSCEIADSKLFKGVTTPQAALVLMMLCEADGVHPINALRRYHIAEGAPTMRADYMQAAFQADGGKIRVIERTREVARAMFSHPVHCLVEKEFIAEINEFSHLQTKANWKNNPAAMLWARLVTGTIRTIHPGIVAGLYSTEEHEDYLYEQSAPGRVEVEIVERKEAAKAADVTLLGYTGEGRDERSLAQIFNDEQAFVDAEIKKNLEKALGAGADKEMAKPFRLLKATIADHLANYVVQKGLVTDPVPSVWSERFNALSKLYPANRAGMRGVIFDLESSRLSDLLEMIEQRLAAKKTTEDNPDETSDAGGPGDGPEDREA